LTHEQRTFERHGVAWVLSGADGSVLQRIEGPFGADQSGVACADLGDVDGDRCDDYAVGWHEGPADRRGFAEVRSGRSGERLLFVRGTAQHARFVANAGDVDGDGRNDFLTAGDPALLATIRSSADGSVLRRFEGRPGARCAANPLVVGDGNVALLSSDDAAAHPVLGFYRRDVAQLVHSSPLEFASRAWRPDRFSLSLVSIGPAPSPHHVLVACANSELCIVSAADGCERARRARQRGNYLRSGIASPGDLDADGVDDLWIGVDDHDEQGGGCVLARSGRDDRLLYTFGDDLDADQTRPAYHVGADLAVIGDIDGDGVRDGLAGCDHALAPGESGMAFAFSGRTGDLVYAFARDGDGVRTSRAEPKSAR
jgi:hypothetical protein